MIAYIIGEDAIRLVKSYTPYRSSFSATCTAFRDTKFSEESVRYITEKERFAAVKACCSSALRGTFAAVTLSPMFFVPAATSYCFTGSTPLTGILTYMGGLLTLATSCAVTKVEKKESLQNIKKGIQAIVDIENKKVFNYV